jgi:hypothetical protein
MPRRRLHGETQKRRTKPQTRLLKRKTSTPPVQATQQPAPFERSARVERDDLEFLEAMRELQVQRSPWRGESLARQQAVERVQFLAEDAESAVFLRSMAHLGVNPLGHGPAPAPDATPPHGASPAAAAPAAPSALAAHEPVRPAPAPAEPGGGNGTAPADPGGANGTPPAAGAEPPPHGSQRPASAPVPHGPTEFETGEDAPGLMASLLRESGFAPELKFAGAVAPPRRAGASRPPPQDDENEPDSELDLHGKTLEEAIRMVQGFLLVCHRQRLKHVLIITGRGHNSGSAGPVLKDAVFRWLELNGKRFAKGFCRAPARLGGEGAIWVTLR